MQWSVVIGLILLLIVVIIAYLFMDQAKDSDPVDFLSGQSKDKTGVDLTQSIFGSIILFNFSYYKKIFSSLKKKIYKLKISSIKGQGLSVSLIVVGVICLFAAVVIVNLVINSSDDTNRGAGGVLDSVCDGRCVDPAENTEGEEVCPNNEVKLHACSGGKICCKPR